MDSRLKSVKDVKTVADVRIHEGKVDLVYSNGLVSFGNLQISSTELGFVRSYGIQVHGSESFILKDVEITTLNKAGFVIATKKIVLENVEIAHCQLPCFVFRGNPALQIQNLRINGERVSLSQISNYSVKDEYSEIEFNGEYHDENQIMNNSKEEPQDVSN